VLIELKTSTDEELVWSESYVASFRHFADLLHLRLLIAWKRNDIWALADTRHFQKRQTAYHLSFETALRENLMHVLFGNVIVVLKEDFQFIVEATVAEPIPTAGLIPEGWYTPTDRAPRRQNRRRGRRGRPGDGGVGGVGRGS